MIRKHKHAKKNPGVIVDMIDLAQSDGLDFGTLRNILKKISALAAISLENKDSGHHSCQEEWETYCTNNQETNDGK